MTDRSAWVVSEVEPGSTAALIRGGHYLHRMPAITTCALLLTVEDWAVGALIWALPPQETIHRYGHLTWELARLWLADVLPRNSETWMIARGRHHVRREHPEVRHLISYADPSRNHRGTIYLADNWHEESPTDSERKTPRFDYYFGSRRISRGNRAVGLSVTRRPRVSKFRFSYCLMPKECLMTPAAPMES